MGARTRPLRRIGFGVFVSVLSAGASIANDALAQPAGGERRVPRFETEILPLFEAHCLKCHGTAAPKGGLDLRTKAAMLAGGESGPALVPGSAESSLLVEVLSQGKMPPKGKARLSAVQVALIKEWVDAGAAASSGPAGAIHDSSDERTKRGRGHWAFQRLVRPDVPRVNDRGRVRTPIDAFVLAKLQAKGFGYSPHADRMTLVRRLYLDLLGLPPTPEDIEAFAQDPSADAYERLVDRLLASPHFGERWGRHWLDGAGFSDILGCDNDAARLKVGENRWRYRDYVIDSINSDKPFDRFLTEQLAGDELVDWRSTKVFDAPTRALLIATGFLRGSADDTDENELNTLDVRHGVLQRTGEILVSDVLSLTFNCAKCHDHKYEPITQRDYYGFLALLQPAFNPQRWLQPGQRQLADVSPIEKAEFERRNAEIDRQAGELSKTVAALRRPYEEKIAADKLARLPEPIRADVRTALATPAEKRNEVLKYLAGKFEASLKVKPEEVSAALTDPDRRSAAAAERRIAELKGTRRTWGHLQVVYDVGPPTPTNVLRRGNHLTPGAEVPAGFLSALCASESDSMIGATNPVGPTSGRRLALARWLNDEGSSAGALALRVRVNRVWQHLFGTGIVETSENFGLTGARPSHRELLEWLASEFRDNGRRLKPLVRLLVTSSVYRQASARASDRPEGDPHAIDPENQLLWSMRLRRLESEAVRDRILAVSGTLDRTIGGPPVPVDPKPDGTFVVREQGTPGQAGASRRSIYLLARRNYHPDLLEAFDQPNLATNCTRRPSSAVVLQSLTMLNNPLVLEQADALADRVAKAAGDPTPARRVLAAFSMTLGRPPSPSESTWCIALLNRHESSYRDPKLPPEQAALESLRHLCHILLNTSEFLYIP